MTDGPYAETREQLGGILVLEARDLDDAVSQHPGVKWACSRCERRRGKTDSK
ncbi:MAG: YciI family protein [Acidobacteriota bacterium]